MAGRPYPRAPGLAGHVKEVRANRAPRRRVLGDNGRRRQEALGILSRVPRALAAA